MTVKDFKLFVLNQSLVGYGGCGEFSLKSNGHMQFWEKLNRLGARNINTHPPEDYPDIDDTVILTEKEEAELMEEFNSLEAIINPRYN